MSSKKIINKKYGLTSGERIFGVVNYVVLVIIALSMLFPFLNMASKSFSSDSAINRGLVVLWPVGFQTGTYQYVLNQHEFWNGFGISLLITLLGTTGAMLVSCMTAYPLSRTWLFGRKTLVLAFVFCMLFSGGMVPDYLLRKSMNMLNTLWVLFVPGMLSVYNMILLKNFFEEIPEAVEESAQLDGAGSLRILFSIILPMSLPAIATIGLFYAVSFWDGYMDGLLYITKPELRPLQTYLYMVVTEATVMTEDLDAIDIASRNTEAIRSATILLASLPIMCVYPFLQKYFVKGLHVGSVKG